MSDLEKLFIEAKSIVHPSQYSLYHFRTVNNYIKNFEKISNSGKNKVSNLLTEYLDLINGGLIIEDDRHSLRLFSEFISPLVIIYQEEAGFTAYVDMFLIVIGIIIIGGIGYLITKSLIAVTVVGFLFLIYYLYVIKKGKEGKVHGYKY